MDPNSPVAGDPTSMIRQLLMNRAAQNGGGMTSNVGAAPADENNGLQPTAGQITNQRDYATKLRGQGMGVIAGPAVSPFEALGGVLQSAAGNKMMNQTNQQDRALQAGVGQGAATVMPMLTVPPPVPQ